ncbi:hypothetical protein [Antrihabitans cavernicola]|uniref:DUF4232 domain-containing protein n=1 Tax=Antrihabitans cavernicola TaxID=2495913 RepID=A0A5A7SC12_9NOCA|nr:hypothetical protein [Spelaeibacter cavernicola]KAA0022025.1 hypothetical protein FOY51_16740 [Spelaeibacter cavernicola]
MLEPNGPLPPEIYWRRRALAIGVGLVALLVLIWIVTSLRGGGDSSDTTAAASSSSLSATSTAAASGSSKASSTSEPSGSSAAESTSGDSTSATESGSGAPTTPASGAPAVPPGQCPDQSLALKATVEQPTYQAGQEPVFGIVITNISTAACARDLGAGLQQALVYSLDGSQRLWSNADCYPNATPDMRTLAPGQQAAFTVKWSGTNSAPDCAGERTPVPPGAYTVVAQLGALRSAPEPFNIA